MSRNILILLLLLLSTLFLFGCEEEKTAATYTNPAEELANSYLKFTPDTQITLTPADGSFNLEVKYPIKGFNPASGTGTITNNFGSQLQSMFNKDPNINKVTILISEETLDGRAIGTFEITKAQFEEIRSNTIDIYSEMPRFLKLDEKYLVEYNLLSYAKTAKDVKIARTHDEDSNITGILVTFTLEKKENKQDWEKTPLDDKGQFENLISNIIRTTFESDKGIGQVRIVASISEKDPRWNSTVIAEFEQDREEFENIVAKWEDLRSRIYDKIEYSPLYLAEYVIQSDLESIEIEETNMEEMSFGGSAKLSLNYADDYSDSAATIKVLEKDFANIIKEFFGSYDISSIEITVKAKVPEENNMKIIEDFYSVTASKDDYEAIHAEGLSNRQFLYNFENTFSAEASKLSITENLLSQDKYFREIEVDSDSGEAEIVLDSCLFKTEPDFKGSMDSVTTQIASGDTTANLQETIANLLFQSAKKMIFQIHPPYLERVVFRIERVYLDTTGNEIDVKDLGEISFDKQEDANYWFQTLDPNELVWVETDDDDLDIGNDEVLCQI